MFFCSTFNTMTPHTSVWLSSTSTTLVYNVVCIGTMVTRCLIFTEVVKDRRLPNTIVRLNLKSRKWSKYLYLLTTLVWTTGEICKYPLCSTGSRETSPSGPRADLNVSTSAAQCKIVDLFSPVLDKCAQQQKGKSPLLLHNHHFNNENNLIMCFFFNRLHVSFICFSEIKLKYW